MTEEAGASPWRVFSADLAASAKTLRTSIPLVAFSVALGVVVAGDFVATEIDRRSRDLCERHDPLAACNPHAWVGPVGLIYFFVYLFEFGFAGTQRVWFLRAHRKQQMTRKEVWRMTWSFLGRYFVLTLLFIPVIALIVALNIGDAGRIKFLSYLVIFVVEVVATFIAPALAFSTRRIRIAIPAGIRMLKESWPSSAWYALAPPLTVFFIGFDLVRRNIGIVPAAISSAIVVPLFHLWLRSATALFYLRRVPDVGPNGAAYLARKVCPNGHEVDKLAFYCPQCGAEVRATA